MIEDKIHLSRWDWTVVVYYEMSDKDIKHVIGTIEKTGISSMALREVRRHLRTMGLDGGLTYTNVRKRQTVMVIGKTSSPAQFYNTLDHEKGHVVQHISDYIGLDNNGEEKQYLAGKLAENIYPSAVKLICGCALGEE